MTVFTAWKSTQCDRTTMHCVCMGGVGEIHVVHSTLNPLLQFSRLGIQVSFVNVSLHNVYTVSVVGLDGLLGISFFLLLQLF